MNIRLSDFLGHLNFKRREHVVKERRLYYGEHVSEAELNYDVLVALDRGQGWIAITRTASKPQHARQKPLGNGRYVCGDEFFIQSRTGWIYVERNGKLLHRGNVCDPQYWQGSFVPHGTLDKHRLPEPYSLCEFRKGERLNRLAKLRNYET